MAILMAIQERNHQKAKAKPVLLKVSPDLNEKQLDEVIVMIKDTGIQGVVATNTTISRDSLQRDKSTAEQAGKGGLSGLPIKDRSTEVIRYLAENQKSFPIIGVGRHIYSCRCTGKK